MILPFFYLMLIAAFFAPMGELHIHRAFSLIPDAMAILLFMMALFHAAMFKTFSVTAKYALLFIVFILHIIVSAVVNQVEPGTLVIGMRFMIIKWVPVFLFPLVYHFSERQLNNLVRFVLVLCFVQVPVALYQKLVQYKDVASGDVITGTLGFGSSGTLSILMLCSISIVVAFYARKRVNIVIAMLVGLILFIPTTLNETKITLVLLPVAMAFPMVFDLREGFKPMRLVAITGIVGVLFVGFSLVYDALYKDSFHGVDEFFSKGSIMERYLYGGLRRDEVTLNISGRDSQRNVIRDQTANEVTFDDLGGRFSQIEFTYKTLSSQPEKLWFGLGLGSINQSNAKGFSGAFGKEISEVASGLSITFMMWQLGLGGVVIFYLFLLFITYDTFFFVRREGWLSDFSLGWIVVMGIFILMTIYFTAFFKNSLMFLFAFFSGLVVSNKARIMADERIT